MKRKFISIMLALYFLLAFGSPKICARVTPEEEEVLRRENFALDYSKEKAFDFKGYYIDDGYNAVLDEEAAEYTQKNRFYVGWAVIHTRPWKNRQQCKIYFFDNVYNDLPEERWSFKNDTVRVPDKINERYVKCITYSCSFAAFDLNPENEYMKCVDNVVLDKDGKTIMSYARFDPREDYFAPDEVVTIAEGAFYMCENLKKVTFSKNSGLKSIGAHAFSNYKSGPIYSPIDEIVVPSFDISIDRTAFDRYGVRNRIGENHEIIEVKIYKQSVKIKSYEKPKVRAARKSISWDNIPNASYYEVYQKLSSGEYKLLKTTKGTSCRFGTLKSGKEYIFAVKPIAVIPAANYDKKEDEGRYPESFTIEGTMSEDISVIG